MHRSPPAAATYPAPKCWKRPGRPARGRLVVTDVLAVGPWHRRHERSTVHRRIPGDFDAEHVLIRVATCVYGSVKTALACEPASDHGRTDATWQYTGAGFGEAATTISDPVRLRMAAPRLGHEGVDGRRTAGLAAAGSGPVRPTGRDPR